jgi:Ni,Fe-hydrogenase III component G
MDGENEYRLQVGGIAKIKKGFFGKAFELIYAGMPTRDTYSVAVHETEGYGSWAYNLFLHVDRKEFRAGNGRVLVMNVNEKEIYLRYVK